MALLKAGCDKCGPVQVFPDEISLLVCALPALSHYWFVCPQCQQTQVKPASDQAIALLLSGGVRPVIWQSPDEIAELRVGPALTYDDLLDFALQLGETDELSGLADRENGRLQVSTDSSDDGS